MEATAATIDLTTEEEGTQELVSTPEGNQVEEANNKRARTEENKADAVLTLLAIPKETWDKMPYKESATFVDAAVDLLKQERDEYNNKGGMDLWEALSVEQRTDIVKKCEGKRRKELPGYKFKKTVSFESIKQELEETFERALCGELFASHPASRCHATVYDAHLFTWEDVIKNNKAFFRMIWYNSDHREKLKNLVRKYGKDHGIDSSDVCRLLYEPAEDDEEDDEEEEEEE